MKPSLPFVEPDILIAMHYLFLRDVFLERINRVNEQDDKESGVDMYWRSSAYVRDVG